MIQYRKATVEDALLLCQTRQKAWAATYRGIFPDEMIDGFDYGFHLAKEQKNLQDPIFHTYLVLDGGECVGYFTYLCSDQPLWRDYHFRLFSLYLLPRMQKNGLGKKLFAGIANACRACGYDSLYLSCYPQNTNALAFYKHMGCRVVYEEIGNESPYLDTVELEYPIPPVICKKATSEDAATVVKLRQKVWKETYQDIYPRELLENYDLDASAARFAARLNDPAHEIYLYLDGNTPVGYFAFGPGNFGSYKDYTLYLNNLYILKAYHGLGLGRKAFEMVSDYCRQHGISGFCCGCNYHNTHAMGFYRHMGGIQGDEVTFHENKADDIVHFEFTLGV